MWQKWLGEGGLVGGERMRSDWVSQRWPTFSIRWNCWGAGRISYPPCGRSFWGTAISAVCGLHEQLHGCNSASTSFLNPYREGAASPSCPQGTGNSVLLYSDLKAKDPGSLSELSVEYVSVCVSVQRSGGLRWGELLSALAHPHIKSPEYSLLWTN